MYMAYTWAEISLHCCEYEKHDNGENSWDPDAHHPQTPKTVTTQASVVHVGYCLAMTPVSIGNK